MTLEDRASEFHAHTCLYVHMELHRAEHVR